MFQKNKYKIAITGGTGFLGKYLVKHLVDLSYEVVVLARKEEAAGSFFSSNVKICTTDYSISSLVEGLSQVDILLHLAGQTMQRDTDPFKISDFFNVNVRLLENILIAGSQTGLKAVYQMSSNNVYSSLNKVPFKETEVAVPSTIYGLSKQYAEFLGAFIATQSSIKVVSLRLARLYGYGERDTVVFSKYMNSALRKECLQVWGHGKTSIEYLYVKDAVDAIETAIRKSIPSGIYNVGCNRSYSVLEIAETINTVTGNNGNLYLDKSKEEGGYHILMDSTKFTTQTGWKLQWELEAAIEDILNYYF